MKQFFGMVLALAVVLLPAASAGAAPISRMPDVQPAMLSSDYWQGKVSKPQQIVMEEAAIARYNAGVISRLPGVVYDLTAYPAALSQQELTALLTKTPLPTATLYVNGTPVGAAYYQMLQDNRNIAQIKASHAVQYGFTVQRADLRTFPTADAALESPQDIEFDQFQETAVEAAQPLLVLHQSQDGQWLYVQTYNYRGWIAAEKIAVTSRQAWLDYQQATEFLVVTGPALELGYNPYTPALSGLRFGMGVKLPLVRAAEVPALVDNQAPSGNYVVKVPTRSSTGQAVFTLALVGAGQDVHEGYLPYTRANVLQQAFKLQGERYGWGGSFQTRDCSAFTHDVYSVFGLQLARNADEQEAAPGPAIALPESLSAAERLSRLSNLQPGALLYMNGHVMMYLGMEQGKAYIIHDIAAQGDAAQGQVNGRYRRLPINQVTVTTLDVTRVNTKTLLQSLHLAKEIRE